MAFRSDLATVFLSLNIDFLVFKLFIFFYIVSCVESHLKSSIRCCQCFLWAAGACIWAEEDVRIIQNGIGKGKQLNSINSIASADSHDMFLFYDFFLLLYYSDSAAYCTFWLYDLDLVLVFYLYLYSYLNSYIPIAITTTRIQHQHQQKLSAVHCQCICLRIHTICNIVLFRFPAHIHAHKFCSFFAIFVSAHQYFVYIYNFLRKYEFYRKGAKMVYEWQFFKC